MINHPNCMSHNWLLYMQCVRFLEKYKEHYGKTVYDLGCGEMSFKVFFKIL